MIFVSTGTVSFPFKRLVDEVQEIFKHNNEKVIIQAGAYKTTSKSNNIKVIDYMDFDKTIQLYKKARINISACGEASLSLLLRHSKNKPIFVPRQKNFNEHVDNQQELIANYIQKKDLGNVVFDINNLFKKITVPLNKNRHRYKNTSNLNTEYLISKLDAITKKID